MKILVYKWNAYALEDVFYVFNKLKIEYDVFTYDFDAKGHSKHYDEEFLKYFIDNFDEKKYDAIFSIAYWAALSDAAMATGMKYISWSYDCPLDTKDPMRTLGNPCNYVFLFDRIQTDYYKKQGLETVFHMPLGINVDRYSKINTHNKKCDAYRTDVSFVGNLYKGNTDGLKSVMDEQSATLIQKIVDTQKNLQGQYILNQLITDKLINEINQRIELNNPNMIGNLSQAGVEYTLAYDVTNYNRLILLMLCAKRFKTDLYTQSDMLNEVEGLTIHGGVNYYTEMPWVFAASRVNLNHTFLPIQSGLPLRALDIMASGGLIVSNRQPEFADDYVEDKEVVLFSDFAEAIDKISYYLSHESIRADISRKGREKTFKTHSMEDKITEMFKISLE